MKYFVNLEFESCSPGCKMSDMDPGFLVLLDEAREKAQTPFYLLSAYRSSEHDKKRGRSGRGFHTLGRAVDVSCSDGMSRWRIINACLSVGLSVGVYSTFLHIDNRPNKVVFYGK